MNWPFADPIDTVVFTSSRILDGSDWVHYVTHDEDDGAWQFHPYSGLTSEIEARIISLEEMTEIEPRIRELADLPVGWHAWRQEPESDWQLGPRNSGER